MKRNHDGRYQPRYSFQEADWLAGLVPGTAKRWLSGYRYKRPEGYRTVGPITPRREPEEGVSFVDLVELVAIGRFRRAGYSLQKIRRIVDRCRHLFRVERPFVELKFKKGGPEVFVQHPDEGLIEVLRTAGQRAWHDILEPFLENVDYGEDGVVERWWPLGKKTPIVVDPAYAFGLPVIRGTGIRTEVILEQFRAGASIREISHDFQVPPELVEEAVRFEVERSKAA